MFRFNPAEGVKTVKNVLSHKIYSTDSLELINQGLDRASLNNEYAALKDLVASTTQFCNASTSDTLFANMRNQTKESAELKKSIDDMEQAFLAYEKQRINNDLSQEVTAFCKATALANVEKLSSTDKLKALYNASALKPLLEQNTKSQLGAKRSS